MQTYEWLGYPLAVDLANTVWPGRPDGPPDLLTEPGGVERWVDAEGARVDVSPRALERRLDDLLELRNSVRVGLAAVVRRERMGPGAIRTINAYAAANARWKALRQEGGVLRAVDVSGTAGADRFLGEIAKSAILLLGSEAAPAVGVCGAPGCGMFYLAERRNQRWCCTSCGNRARVARHYARTRAS